MVSVGVASPPWHHVLARLLFAIFLFELGVFLIIYPWLDAWTSNRFATFGAESLAAATFADFWRSTWVNPYFRGAISGLGVVNIYISLLEVFSMRRRRAEREGHESIEDHSDDSVE